MIFLTGWLAKEAGKNKCVVKWANILSLLVLAQLGVGAATLLTHSPIVMQIAHLFLVDAIWISYVLFAANFSRFGIFACHSGRSIGNLEIVLSLPPVLHLSSTRSVERVLKFLQLWPLPSIV